MHSISLFKHCQESDIWAVYFTFLKLANKILFF
uniref:Uncharacterized protein n=1 Tax=Anguilla anguilla TaxID=7936 RepID=A0A0E9WGY4_ANGAN